MNEVVLKAEGLNLSFGGNIALEDVTIEITKGDICALVGPNGSGKTCILNVISGLYKADSGKVFYEGHDITGIHPHKVAALGIARAFQNVELFGNMTVLENLLLGCHYFMKENFVTGGIFWGLAQKREIQLREWIESVIDFLELEKYRKQMAGMLPIGVQKLIGVARALCMKPRLLLLDEVGSGMNRQEKEDLARFLLRIKYELDIPMLWVEHDVKLVGDLCDRIVVLNYGQKIADGAPDEVFQSDEVLRVYAGLGET